MSYKAIRDLTPGYISDFFITVSNTHSHMSYSSLLATPKAY